jgi:enamine deaminase RidA (YjgF/YER057c/UK114 family)
MTLPEAPAPVAAYVPAVRTGSMLFISGQLPFRDGSLMATGCVPTDVTTEEAQNCAEQCVLNGLAAAKAHLGTLDTISRVVRVGCFVCSASGFGDQPKIANGASELLQEIFGETGRHARAALGSVALPLNAPVEIEFLFEVTD